MHFTIHFYILSLKYMYFKINSTYEYSKSQHLSLSPFGFMLHSLVSYRSSTRKLEREHGQRKHFLSEVSNFSKFPFHFNIFPKCILSKNVSLFYFFSVLLVHLYHIKITFTVGDWYMYIIHLDSPFPLHLSCFIFRFIYLACKAL